MARGVARGVRRNRPHAPLRGIRGILARSPCHYGFQGNPRGRLREPGLSTAYRQGRGSRCVRSAARLHLGHRQSQIPAAQAGRPDLRGARHSLRRPQYLGRDGRHADDVSPHAADPRGKATMNRELAAQSRMRELLAIMERLRAADGCPWDRAQTFASIAPYTIEEAYEVADAVERGDMGHLRDELGDLLFQVVFHAQIASEANQFDFEAVAGAICDKLLRRHPHVFGSSGPLTQAEQSVVWEDIKAAERSAANPERSAANPERSAANAEHGAANAEHGAANAERGAANAERG